jgi:hypothetical protein
MEIDRLPSNLRLEIQINASSIQISGPDPFVDLSGNIESDGQFVVTGNKTLGELLDVVVRMEGVLRNGSIDAEYFAEYTYSSESEFAEEDELSINYLIDGSLISVFSPEIGDFLRNFLEANHTGNTEFLVGSIHPEFIDFYGETACQNRVVEIIDPSLTIDIQAIRPADTWTVTVDGQTFSFTNVFTIVADVSRNGVINREELHFVEENGTVYWFIDCGVAVTAITEGGEDAPDGENPDGDSELIGGAENGDDIVSGSQESLGDDETVISAIDPLVWIFLILLLIALIIWMTTGRGVQEVPKKGKPAKKPPARVFTPERPKEKCVCISDAGVNLVVQAHPWFDEHDWPPPVNMEQDKKGKPSDTIVFKKLPKKDGISVQPKDTSDLTWTFPKDKQILGINSGDVRPFKIGVQVEYAHVNTPALVKCCTVVDVKFVGKAEVNSKPLTSGKVKTATLPEAVIGKWEISECNAESANYSDKAKGCKTVKFTLSGFETSVKGSRIAVGKEDPEKSWSGNITVKGDFEIWINQYKKGKWSGDKSGTRPRRDGRMP